MAKDDAISLYDHVKTKGFEAAIVSAYSIDFAFYERVVLRRLQSAGCRHNLLLVDAKQCGRNLSGGSSSPRFAGSDYTLLPVRAEGAFHPKFILLVGRKKARLVVGSHNVTLSGFGVAREVSTVFDIAPDSADSATAQQVWAFVRAWADGMGKEIRRLLEATERLAPWLVERSKGETPLLVTVPKGDSLWSQLLPRLEAPVSRVTVVSPYFDAACSLLRTIEKDLRPKHLIVAIQPQHVLINRRARSLVKTGTFVDISSLGEDWASRRLHAKVFRFDCADGRAVVITGSANASDPAWLGSERRNAEIVVVHEDGDRLWKELGLNGISELRPVDDQGWADIAQREDEEQDGTDEGSHRPCLAFEVESGFLVDQEFTAGLKAAAVTVVSADGGESPVQGLEPRADGVLVICADANVRATAAFLRASAKDFVRTAIIHRISDLLDRAAGTVHQAFRRALTGLSGDPQHLAELMNIVDKVIFDAPVSVQEVIESGGRVAGAKQPKSKTEEPTSLMVPAKDTVKGRRRRKVSAATDLALIIDALIYKLGLGLMHEDTDSAASVKDKEQQRGSDNEREPDVEDGYVLAKFCRGKVNRLFKRMLQQMEAAVTRDANFSTPIIQLAAVLGVVRHLRTSKVAWLPRGERLVDHDHALEFFKGASRLLYAPELDLAAKTIAENGGEEFDELTISRALLSWLAFDCELDTRSALSPGISEADEVRENLVGVAYLLPVMTECSHDDFAQEMLKKTVESNRKGEARVDYHLRWAERIERSAVGTRQPAKFLVPGDIAIPFKMKTPRPAVVLEVENTKVRVVDLMTGGPKAFNIDYLGKV